LIGKHSDQTKTYLDTPGGTQMNKQNSTKLNETTLNWQVEIKKALNGQSGSNSAQRGRDPASRVSNLWGTFKNSGTGSIFQRRLASKRGGIYHDLPLYQHPFERQRGECPTAEKALRNLSSIHHAHSSGVLPQAIRPQEKSNGGQKVGKAATFLQLCPKQLWPGFSLANCSRALFRGQLQKLSAGRSTALSWLVYLGTQFLAELSDFSKSF
jgi:hypothetical protein